MKLQNDTYVQFAKLQTAIEELYQEKNKQKN
jgi:hypothetical protein